jgi:hypothetical protein
MRAVQLHRHAHTFRVIGGDLFDDRLIGVTGESVTMKGDPARLVSHTDYGGIEVELAPVIRDVAQSGEG